MVEKLRQIPQKILEWWNKFESRQKTIIVSVTAGVIVALAILISVLTKPVYEVLVTCESTKEASQIIELFESADPVITYKTSTDGYQISGVFKNFEGNESGILYSHLQKDRYNSIRDIARFKAIETKLSEYAEVR